MTSSCRLPLELADEIIDAFDHFPDKRERIQALTAASLVSRTFGQRARQNLFRDLSIPAGNVSLKQMARICAFRELVDFDHHPEALTRIITYVTSFHLHWSVDAPTPETLKLCTTYSLDEDNEVVIAILTKLFQAGTSPCSVSLEVEARDPLLIRAFNSGAKFSAAFFDLLQNPRVATLHCSGLHDFPVQILLNSYVKHLELRNASTLVHSASLFAASALPSNADNLYRCIHLESLVTDFKICPDSLSIASPRGVGTTKSRDRNPAIFFPSLKDITLYLSWKVRELSKEVRQAEEARSRQARPTHVHFVQPVNGFRWRRRFRSDDIADLEKKKREELTHESDRWKLSAALLRQASVLERLTLHLTDWSGFEAPKSPRLVIGHLESLRELTLIRQTVFPRTNDNLGYTELKHIFRPKDVLPLSLKRLRVSFCLTSFKFSSNDVGKVFSDLDFSLVDDFFSHSRFHGLDSLTFLFDFYFLNVPESDICKASEFLDKSRGFLLNAFPRLLQTNPCRFDAVVDVKLMSQETQFCGCPEGF